MVALVAPLAKVGCRVVAFERTACALGSPRRKPRARVSGQELTAGSDRLGSTLVERCHGGGTSHGGEPSRLRDDRHDGPDEPDESHRRPHAGAADNAGGAAADADIAEAAEVLRLSRSSAYKLVEEHRATGGHSRRGAVDAGGEGGSRGRLASETSNSSGVRKSAC